MVAKGHGIKVKLTLRSQTTPGNARDSFESLDKPYMSLQTPLKDSSNTCIYLGAEMSKVMILSMNV